MVSSVMQKFRTDERTYILDLVFGFVILPEHTGFSHSVVLEASSADIGKTEKYLEWARSCSWRSPFVQRGEVFDILCHLGSIEIRHCGNSALWFHQPFFCSSCIVHVAPLIRGETTVNSAARQISRSRIVHNGDYITGAHNWC